MTPLLHQLLKSETRLVRTERRQGAGRKQEDHLVPQEVPPTKEEVKQDEARDVLAVTESEERRSELRGQSVTDSSTRKLRTVPEPPEKPGSVAEAELVKPAAEIQTYSKEPEIKTTSAETEPVQTRTTPTPDASVGQKPERKVQSDETAAIERLRVPSEESVTDLKLTRPKKTRQETESELQMSADVSAQTFRKPPASVEPKEEKISAVRGIQREMSASFSCSPHSAEPQVLVLVLCVTPSGTVTVSPPLLTSLPHFVRFVFFTSQTTDSFNLFFK